MAPADAPPMKFDRVTERAGATRDLGFMALETSDEGDVHDVYYNGHSGSFQARWRARQSGVGGSTS